MFCDSIFGDPEISPESFVSSKSCVIGRVIIEPEVIVAPGASIRADEGCPFRICHGTNIQDEVIIHGLLEKYVDAEGEKYSVYIGPSCSIAHGAVIHGPSKIGKKTFIGFRAIVHNAEIGEHCHIGHGAIVVGVKISDHKFVPAGAVVNSQEIANRLAAISENEEEFNMEVVDYNKLLVKRYQERRKKKEEQGMQ